MLLRITIVAIISCPKRLFLLKSLVFLIEVFDYYVENFLVD